METFREHLIHKYLIREQAMGSVNPSRDTQPSRAGNPTGGDLSPRGHAAARQLLDLPEPPTAVVTTNDLQATGVYQAARETGRSVPTDLSIVGFDDLPIADLMDPPLTTVRQPLAEMAAAATELALALGRGERSRNSASN